MAIITKGQNCIRRKYILKNRLNEITIIVSGIHGKQWSVTVVKPHYNKTLMLENSAAALKEVKQLKQSFRKCGDCTLRLQ